MNFSNKIDVKAIQYIKIIEICADIHIPKNKKIGVRNIVCCFTRSIETIKNKIFKNLQDNIHIKFVNSKEIVSDKKFLFVSQTNINPSF